METSYLYNYYNRALDQLYGAYKNGYCTHLHSRFESYTTYYIEPGRFINAYEFQCSIDGHPTAKYVENKLHHYLVEQQKHVFRPGGGTEFFMNDSEILIEPFIQTLGIPYKKLTPEDIEILSTPSRPVSAINADIISLTKHTPSKKRKQKPDTPEIARTPELRSNVGVQAIPKEHQIVALDKFDETIQTTHIVKLIWACGLGKALFSIFAVKRNHFKTVAIGVPSNYLQKQMRFEILRLFPSAENILFVGGEPVNDEFGETNTTNNPRTIREFLVKTHLTDPRFVITTYHSSHLLGGVEDFIFDFKIGDEAHHLATIATSDPARKTFQRFHDIPSKYTLFMTATEKIVDTSTGREVYSMDDERVFGRLISSISVKWAIDNRKITDYMVVLLKNREDDVDAILARLNIQRANKDLFLSAYMSVKSIEKYSTEGRAGPLTHMLLYTNTIEDADLANQYIRQIVEYIPSDERGRLVSFNPSDLYAKSLHSNTDQKICLKTELAEFTRSRFGIISCVYMFGEGVNIPELNCVCLASNMKSEIRIVQYVLRPNRLDRTNPDKIAYVIVPILDCDDFDSNSSARYGRVRETISQLRNIDDTVSSKMRLLEIQTRKPSDDTDTDNEDNSTTGSRTSSLDLEMFESEEELAKLTLRLRYSKALRSSQTQEKDEYDYVQRLNRELGINSKQKYIDAKHTHKHYIDDPEHYFVDLWKDWYHFWGVDTSAFLPTKEEWIRFCREKKVVTVNDYLALCREDERLPLNPELFYRGFTNICNELRVETRRR